MIRSKFHLSENESGKLLSDLKEKLNIEEAIVVSTCNRTEIYYSCDNDISKDVITLLSLTKEVYPFEEYLQYFDYINDSKAAAKRLFEVAMGLHSLVLGDIQIINQVKSAYSQSIEADCAGPFIHRLLHTIFHANKRVYQETAFRDGGASVSYVASNIALQLAKSTKIKAVVVGLGEMGKDVADNLAKNENIELTLVNRTFSKAETLAKSHQCKAMKMEDFFDQIPFFDVFITAVSVKEALLKKSHFLSACTHKPYYIVDISIPSATDSELAHLPNVVYYSVDDLSEIVDNTLENRKAAMNDVRKIVEEDMTQFATWSQELNFSPAIHQFKQALEEIRKEEMQKFLKVADSEREIELAENITKRYMNKIIKLPVLQLKAACKRGEGETLAKVLVDLFNVEDEKVNY